MHFSAVCIRSISLVLHCLNHSTVCLRQNIMYQIVTSFSASRLEVLGKVIYACDIYIKSKSLSLNLHNTLCDCLQHVVACPHDKREKDELGLRLPVRGSGYRGCSTLCIFAPQFYGSKSYVFRCAWKLLDSYIAL